MRSSYKKKLLSAILAVAMTLVSVSPTSLSVVKAAEAPSLVVGTEKDSVQRGETFKVTLSLQGELAAASGQAALKYDENQLEVVKTERGNILTHADAVFKDVNSDLKGEIFTSFLYDIDKATGAGELFTAEFKVKENASGKIKLGLEETEFNQINFQEIAVKLVEKELTVNVPLQSISLNKTDLAMNVGAEEKLAVTYAPSDASEDKNVLWTSANEKVATVSADGTVKAIGKGSTIITAKVGTKTAECKVQVNNPITGISIPETLNLKKGQMETLKVTYIPEDADQAGNVVWTSDNTDVAEVSANGTVTAKADGTANITATLGEFTAKCLVTVKEIKLESISLNKEEMTIARNTSEKLTVSYNPENTTDDKSVTWSVSDNSVISVDGDGNVTGKAIGKAIVTARVGIKEATCEVTVNAPLEKIDFSITSIELLKGQSTDELKSDLVFFPADTTDSKDVEWVSSNPSVVSVNEDGRINALKAGNAEIKAIGVNNTEAICKVTVVEIPIEGVILNHTEAEIEEGNTLQLEASVLPENTTDNKTIVWKSKDESIASVDNNGLVTAHKGGSTVITATAPNGKMAECNILVPIHMQGIEIQEPSTTEVLKGKTISLIAKGVPENITDKYTVTWSSSDETIAKVDQDGMVTGIKEGQVEIIAKSGSFEDRITITVKEIHMTGIKLSYNNDNLNNGKLLKGQSLKVNVEFLPEDTTDDRTVYWESSNEEIAMIDANGIVTGVKAGKVTVVAKVGNFEEKLELEVVEIPVESIAFDRVISTMVEGQQAILTVIYNPEDATDVKEVIWSSSDEEIISVIDGRLVAKKAGKAVITAKVGELSISCEITVKPKDVIIIDDGSKGDGAGNSNENTDGNETSVKTGDTFNVLIPAVLAILSLITIAFIFMRRKIRR